MKVSLLCKAFYPIILAFTFKPSLWSDNKSVRSLRWPQNQGRNNSLLKDFDVLENKNHANIISRPQTT